jgi:hypothetical protein
LSLGITTYLVMTRILITALLVCTMLAAGAGNAAWAQTMIPPGWSPLSPPPPAPPPPPKIEVPVIPKMDELPRQRYVQPSRGSFSDRVARCLHDAGAAGLRHADRDSYTRACANQ